jgi:hypothetical protein
MKGFQFSTGASFIKYCPNGQQTKGGVPGKYLKASVGRNVNYMKTRVSIKTKGGNSK